MFWRHQGGLIKGLCLTGSLLWGLTGWAAATAGSQLKSRPVPTVSAAPAKEKAPQPLLKSVRLTWPVVPGAVQYQVVLLKSAADTSANIVLTRDQVFTNGVDLDLSAYGSAASEFYWKVCPLDYQGKAIGSFTEPQPMSGASVTINPTSPLPTTQFDQMDYTPLYPVYSWVPMAGAKQHEVQVWREKNFGDDLIRTLQAGEYDYYEDGGYTVPGQYYWRVRSLDASGNPASEWSTKMHFRVKPDAPIAALGDSITHGGGVMSVPPGYTLYDWETYSQVPVKNLGYSGNTTADMVERFERDVLPFHPKVLVIMGGVNDYRAGTLGWTTVQHLATLRNKCNTYGIIPVFMTVTPINPSLFSRAGIEQPPFDWQVHQQYINAWIMGQKYAVDVSTMLTDGAGNLRRDYTTDGLHPDYFGKKYIGETIGHYLAQHFPWVTGKLVKQQPQP